MVSSAEVKVMTCPPPGKTGTGKRGGKGKMDWCRGGNCKALALHRGGQKKNKVSRGMVKKKGWEPQKRLKIRSRAGKKKFRYGGITTNCIEKESNGGNKRDVKVKGGDKMVNTPLPTFYHRRRKGTKTEMGRNRGGREIQEARGKGYYN